MHPFVIFCNPKQSNFSKPLLFILSFFCQQLNSVTRFSTIIFFIDRFNLGSIRTGKDSFTTFVVFAKIFDCEVRKSRVRVVNDKKVSKISQHWNTAGPSLSQKLYCTFSEHCSMCIVMYCTQRQSSKNSTVHDL